MTRFDGPPLAVSRRTSSVAGKSVPVTSAIIASVSVSRPSAHSHVVSSVAVPSWYTAVDDRRGTSRTHGERARVPAADEPTEDRRPVEAGKHIQSIAPSEATRAAVRVSPRSP